MLLLSRSEQSPYRSASLQVSIRHSSVTESFGRRLRTLRVTSVYTQTQLADYLGIGRSFISDVERGKKNMSLSYLETVAQGFHMSISELTRDL